MARLLESNAKAARAAYLKFALANPDAFPVSMKAEADRTWEQLAPTERTAWKAALLPQIREIAAMSNAFAEEARTLVAGMDEALKILAGLLSEVNAEVGETRPTRRSGS